MGTLYIDSVSAPEKIKKALKDLTVNIDFDREATKGANSYLFFGKNKVMDTPVAVKFYYWGSDKTYHAEPQRLAQVRSPNVLTIHDAALIDDDWAYFVTSHCQKGDLDDLLQKTHIGNHKAIDMVSQVLNGLTHLHAQRFLHRDLKPSNIYIGDDDQAIIGDFGSVKKLPEGQTSLIASKHSVLYRPPESILSNRYGFTGDVYQVGILLYQLLGGCLPYEETSWLSKQELRHYSTLTDNVDKTIFVDQCVKSRIASGKILNMSSLPLWVPDSLKKIIKKATGIEQERRFPTASAFMARLYQLKPSIPNWRIVDGFPTLIADNKLRIVENNGVHKVQKNCTGIWRTDNSFDNDTLEGLIMEISRKI